MSIRLPEQDKYYSGNVLQIRKHIAKKVTEEFIKVGLARMEIALDA